MDQLKVWRNEYRTRTTFVRIHSDMPSRPVPRFAGLIRREASPSAAILDIGCGTGRNSIYLAKRGFRVSACDFVDEAVDTAKARSKDLRIDFRVVDLGVRWPYPNSAFDAVLDCNSTVNLRKNDRSNAISEALRVLKPGGHYLFYGMKAGRGTGNDPEPNSFLVNGKKFEKHYSKDELFEAYKGFNVVRTGNVYYVKDVIGSKALAVRAWPFWVVVFQKPRRQKV